MATIGNLIVNLEARTAAFEKALRNARRRTSAFERAVAGMGRRIGQVLRYATAAAGGLAAVSLKAWAEQEKQERLLDTALKSVGASVETYGKRLREAARQIQQMTTVGDEAALAIMRQGLNLGVAAGQVDEFTRMTIGLSKALGLDMTAATRYAALALQGEFTVLRRYIPALRQTTDATQQLAIVQEVAARGWQQARAETETFGGRLQQLRNRLGDLAERLGKALMPMLEGVISRVEAFAARLERMTDIEVAAWIDRVATALEALAAVWVGSKLVGMGAGIARIGKAAAVAVPVLKGLATAAASAAASFAPLIAAITAPLVVGGGLILYFKHQAATLEKAGRVYDEINAKFAELAQQERAAQAALASATTPSARLQALQQLLVIRDEMIAQTNKTAETMAHEEYQFRALDEAVQRHMQVRAQLVEQISKERRALEELNRQREYEARLQREQKMEQDLATQAVSAMQKEIERLAYEKRKLLGKVSPTEAVYREFGVTTAAVARGAESLARRIINLRAELERLQRPAPTPTPLSERIPWMRSDFAERARWQENEGDRWLARFTRPRSPVTSYQIGTAATITGGGAQVRGLAMAGQQISEQRRANQLLEKIEQNTRSNALPWQNEPVLPWQ